MVVIALPCDLLSAAVLEFVFAAVGRQKLQNLFNQPADIKSGNNDGGCMVLNQTFTIASFKRNRQALKK
ncbi:hypothetical protein CCACVL1_10660 [Corchorus capsularis]|uniref:Uncharacterized protein n=1 Tax=Corchorus capsularis TaxID=210143 RepID=A0A1R3IQB6_COCAP|nr:hypothetical protein CCACVL1_10660 [Corchorus capsularis]